MKLYLLGKETLKVFKLPQKIDESVSINEVIDDNFEIQLNIEAENGKWVLKSNDTFSIIENDTKIFSVELKDYQYYFLNIEGIEKNIVLYTLPVKDTNNYNLSFDNLSRIGIGSSNDNEICYKDSFIQPNHAEIVKATGENETGWKLNSLQDNARIYVNNNLVKSKILNIGDIIFINGLKIIWMGSFLNVNNPNELVAVQRLNLYQRDTDNSNYQTSNDTDNNLNLYQENDYFYHTLRMDDQLKEEYVKIEPVPQSEIKEDMPLFLSIGSSITMAASSLMTGYTVIYGLSTGNKTIMSSLPQIVMCVTMIFGSLIIPRIASKYQKKQAAKREKLRVSKYTSYILEKQNQIMDIKKKQEQTLKDNNPSAIECYQMLTTSNKITNIKFWSRLITDYDFLTVRLGSGTCLSKIVIDAPERHFTLDEDDLLNQVYNISEQAKNLNNIPITVSLLDNPVTGLIINNSHEQEYINSLILQLVSLHSSIDLKIVIMTNDANKDKWEYAKYLPHCFSDDKETRFFATNLNEISEISSYLEDEYKKRKASSKSTEDSTNTVADEEEVAKKESYKKNSPYYLVINDDYNLAKNSIIIDLLLKTATNYGFSYLCIGDKIKNLPGKCDAFIEITEKNGTIISEKEDQKEIIKFNNEYALDIDMRKISNKLANIPVVTKDGISVLPNSLAFLEMMKVSKIEQLNILSRWQNNNPVVSLATPVGVHANGEEFKLDLHEKFHGPHGLIAGMTGSGKSELIITYILSLAVNYHPYEVQFVLIDYKGGGLAGAFENKETGVKIPHLIGTITNLDTAEMNRTLVSIDSELKRRQRVFNEVRDKLGEGTIDIYKYQKLYREGAVSEPMAHLFIISDEFAELKSQQPEFMQQLISTARIGRSLGLHLILATQKPSGVVNDQIWSNSKFKVCLKVQDRSDSMEMLKRPEAASIKETGRFYLQVGYNDYFDIGQSGWSGAKYVPSDRIIKKVDDSINFVNDVGYPVKTIKDMVKENNDTNYGEQLTNLVKYIYNLSTRENIVTKKLWLDALPSDINLFNLKKKYNYKPVPYVINPVIGEYDNPSNQEQGILNVDLTNKGNTLIYGQTGSGKENLLSTMIFSMMAEHTPDEVNMYIIDCGSETLKMFYNIPHVGEVATIEDSDLVYDIFEMINDEIERRKELFKDYAGSYNEYLQNSGKKLPLIVTMINSYEIFVENFSKLSEAVQNLYRDGVKYGIVFIISAISTNGVRGRMVQNFANRLCLQIPNETEYRTVVDAPRGLFPSKIFGRGLIAMNDTAYEFQTASFAPRKDMTNVMREVSKQLNNAYTSRARKIPVLPKVVTLDLLEQNNTLDKIPIGYNVATKQPITYNFMSIYNSIVTRSMNYDRMSFVISIIELIKKAGANISICDFVNAYDKENDIKCYKKDFDQSVIQIHNEALSSKNNGNDYYYVFLGIGMLRKYLSQNGQAILNHLFQNIGDATNIHFILVDTYDSYKNLQLEVWYQSNINSLYGIWLGEDVGSQLAFNIPNLTMDDRKINFPYMGFAINDGNYTVFKHVVEKEVEQNEK